MYYNPGLNATGLLQTIRKYPALFLPAFTKSVEQLSAEKMQKLFQYTLSECGSNRRTEEENIILNWGDFLEDVEGISGDFSNVSSG